MAKRKSTNKYYFSVEGETEQWYLKWLQDVINGTEESTYKVSFDCPVQKNPYKWAKTFIVLKTENKKVDIYHLSDYESDEPIHVQQFTETMDNMKKANEAGKYINYKFGYNNLTFDLWIILHKADCNGSVSHRKNYIAPINRAYEESFESMDEYKHEDNFKRCLGKLQLSNVIAAVNRAKAIMQKNQDNYTLHQYKGYKYYKENPLFPSSNLGGTSRKVSSKGLKPRFLEIFILSLNNFLIYKIFRIFFHQSPLFLCA